MSESFLYATPSILRESSNGIERISIQDEMLANRQIEVVGEINTAMTYSLCQQLRYLQRDDPQGEITIFFNSPGGTVVDGLAIYDVMQAVSCPIHTVCLGLAASMASLLFIAGDTRELLPHASVMIHDPLIPYGVGGSALSVKASSDHLMRTRQISAEIIARHTGHSIEEVFAVTAQDTFFEATEAVEWGLADRVIEQL